MADARITQDALEVAWQNTAGNVRVSHMIISALRVGPAPAARIFPVAQAERIGDNGGGTRIFPLY
jgi:hypothetical protein